MVLRWSHT